VIARKEPVERVGGVAIYQPTLSKPYFRLKWTEPDGSSGDTSGGTVLDLAILKATDVDARVCGAAGPAGVATVQEVVEAFLASGISPYKSKAPYKRTNLSQLRNKLNRSVRGHEQLRAMDVTREVLDIMRAQAGTDKTVSENTTALRALLYWGHQNKYFSAHQADLLPRGCVMPAPTRARKRTRIDNAPDHRRTRQNGQHEDFVGDEDAPARDQVRHLGAQLQRRFPLWGALAPEFAAGTGCRWGEQFQLTAGDVHLSGCASFEGAHVHIEWQAASSDEFGSRRVAPKGDITRVVPVPTLSFTGYPLRKNLDDRIGRALKEQAAGTNPEALIFPAARGGILWHSAFSTDHLLPAMQAAGWPVERWSEEAKVWDEDHGRHATVTTERRNAVLTWHSLRHRFARTCVDVLRMPEGELMAVGGWQNIATVQNRYYRSGRENMQRGLAYFQ
jgi:integrase